MRTERLRARPRVEPLEDRTVPATAFALTNANALLRFDTASPTVIQSTINVTGLVQQGGGETLRGIDFIPGVSGAFAQDTLFGLGVNGALAWVYSINTTTGTATVLGPAFAVNAAATSFGFDFNPTNLLIRITNDADENFAFNPIAGTVAVNTALTAGATIAGSAYDRNDTDAGTPTTLYGIDFANDTLNLQGSVNGLPNGPGGGVISVLGNLGVNTDANVGFDIVGPGNGPGVPDTFAGLAGYAALRVGGVSGLYTINLGTGAATLVNPIGTGAAVITGLAVQTTLPPNTITTGTGLATFPGLRSIQTDLTGDGVLERVEATGVGLFTRVRIRNATTGALIRSFRPFGLLDRGGAFVAAADLNGDGVQEIIVGSGVGSRARVRVFNSQTGALQATLFAGPNTLAFRKGVKVAVADVNGDGRPDIIAKTQGTFRTVLTVFNGQTLSVLQTLSI